MLLALAVLAIKLIYQLTLEAPILEALGASGAAALAVFLSWAIGREIDPAHDWSAFVALPFTFGAALLYGSPALAALLFALLLGRFINGSTGLRATVFDAALLIALGAVLFAGGTPAALPFLAAAFGLDGALYAPASSRRRMGLYALISLALFVLMVFFLYPQHYYVSGFNIYTGIAALALILSTVVLVALAAQGWVTGDNNGKPLDIRRIRLAQVLVVLFIIAGLLIQGSSALVMFYPACFAYLGTAAFNLIRRPEPDG